MDPEACNYDEAAVLDDGGCIDPDSRIGLLQLGGRAGGRAKWGGSQ